MCEKPSVNVVCSKVRYFQSCPSHFLPIPRNLYKKVKIVSIYSGKWNDLTWPCKGPKFNLNHLRCDSNICLPCSSRLILIMKEKNVQMLEIFFTVILLNSNMFFSTRSKLVKTVSSA